MFFLSHQVYGTYIQGVLVLLCHISLSFTENTDNSQELLHRHPLGASVALRTLFEKQPGAWNTEIEFRGPRYLSKAVRI